MARCHTHSCAFSIEIRQGMGYAPAVVLYRSGRLHYAIMCHPRVSTCSLTRSSIFQVIFFARLDVRTPPNMVSLAEPTGSRVSATIVVDFCVSPGLLAPGKKTDLADWDWVQWPGTAWHTEERRTALRAAPHRQLNSLNSGHARRTGDQGQCLRSRVVLARMRFRRWISRVHVMHLAGT